VAVDLTRSFRGLLDGALERARQRVNSKQYELAAGEFDQAASLSVKIAEHALSAAEKKRRLEAAQDYRQQAEKCRQAAKGSIMPAGGGGATSHSGPQVDRNETENELESAVTQLIIKTNVAWDDIAGLEDTKRSIKSAYALSLAQAPTGVKLSPLRNMLFYGPPGCGKSLLAAATSNGLDSTFFNVKVSSLLSKYFGESPKLVTTLYNEARERAPSVIFLDEVDALAGSRDGGTDSGPERRVLANMLAELDGVAEKGGSGFVLSIAATNTPWSLDAAVLSRFERKIYIPLPDHDARRAILDIHLEKRGYRCDVPLDDLARRTEGMSGREMERLSKTLIEAMITEMNPDLADLASKGREAVSSYQVKVRPISQTDVEAALALVRPETTRAALDRYEQWGQAQ